MGTGDAHTVENAIKRKAIKEGRMSVSQGQPISVGNPCMVGYLTALSTATSRYECGAKG